MCQNTDYYSYGEHCWVFLQIWINFNTKWRASNTFEAHSGGPEMVNMDISIPNTVFFSYNVTAWFKLNILVSLVLSYS